MTLGGRVFGTLLLVGAGALAVAAIAAGPALLRARRPEAREALRRGFKLYKRVRDATVEFAEDVEDLVAEVQGELKTRREPDTHPGEAKQG